MICSVCGAFTVNRHDLMDHLYDEHSIKCVRESLSFPNIEQFKLWKTNMETETAAHFEQGAPYKRIDGSRYVIFYCSRQRVTKTFCPAYFSINERADGMVSVDFVKTHLGHDHFGIKTEKSPQPSERSDLDEDPTLEDYARAAYKFEKSEAKARALESYKTNMTQLWEYVKEELANSTSMKELQVFETLVRPIVPTLRVLRDAETKTQTSVSPSSSKIHASKRKSTKQTNTTKKTKRFRDW